MVNFVRVNSFLGAETRDELLKFAITSEADFLPTKVGAVQDGETKSNVRRSVRVQDIGAFKGIFEKRVIAQIPALTSDLRLSSFATGDLEIELVAHADGGFYKRHIDTFTGDTRSGSGDRIISCVYYFFQEPKTFSGGELRLYPLRTVANPDPLPIDVAIENDTLIAFSSWLPHEVMPVTNPSAAFADSRFSINCWVHRVPGVRS